MVGVLVIESEKELSERCSMLAIYMLNIYANQLSLLYKSQLDPLTELLNRQTFDKKVIEIAEPSVMMTMFVSPKAKKVNGFVTNLMENNEVPFIISGSDENLDAIEDAPRINKVSSPQEFQDYLTKVKKVLSV